MSVIDRSGSGDALVEAARQSECFDMIGGRLELVARMSHGEDGSVLFRTSMAPGQVVPLHSHIDPECFYLLNGRLEVFLLNGIAQWRTVLTGQSVVVTDGVKHALRNPAREAADVLVMTNVRLAAFFRDSSRPAAQHSAFSPAGPEDIKRVVQTAKTYGYWLSSPAEHAAVTGDPPS